ncbi:MAG: phenylalanine--tRNA ligase subunit beta-related protein, partial [Chitinophagaceae bacterium]
VKDILNSLGFEVLKEGIDELRVAVPYHKPDISLPADLVEEILRIDGLDNVAIPESITITPSVEENYAKEVYREKIANYLVGRGFYEIMTNSITNSAYFTSEELASSVKMLNNLSAELNILRPSMLETGLEAIAHNLNRKNNDLCFFEFGKTYTSTGSAQYKEPEHLCLYITGKTVEEGWKIKPIASDFYLLKGIVTKILQSLGISIDSFESLPAAKFENCLEGKIKGEAVLQIAVVDKEILNQFDIKQPVFFADLNWDTLSKLAARSKPAFNQVPKYPAVQRDLAMIVSSQLPYEEVEKAVQKIKINKLQGIKLFDIFKSEKLGIGKKSLAVNFTFVDEEKTLTDSEIDGWMNKIMSALEKDLQAEIRK